MPAPCRMFRGLPLVLQPTLRFFRGIRGRTGRYVLTVALTFASGVNAQQAEYPPPVVIDASAFAGRMPLRDQMTNAAELGEAWLFNNNALRLLQRSNVQTEVQIPQSGTYFLYARSRSEANSSFRVALGRQLSTSISSPGAFTWQRVGEFQLEAGRLDVRITRINTAPIVDVLMLSPDPALPEDALPSLQLGPDVEVVREYRIPPALSVNLGDADNDGRLDLLIMRPGYSVTVMDHDGKELWSYEGPQAGRVERSTDDINGLIWDLDGDGATEVLHWRFMEDREWLVVADARTGEIKNRTPWPTAPLPHAYNNHRIAIARFSPGPARHILVYSDPGSTISLTAYTADLQQVWRHEEVKRKDHLGHYPYLFDLNGDGIEEVVVSGLALDANGRKVWDRFDIFDDHHDHADMYRMADFNGDGRPELVAGWSDVGVVALDGLTGGLLWWNQAEHTQRVEVGDFLDDSRGPHIAASARFYGNRQFEPYLWAQVHWFDSEGNLLSKWPEYPINTNPVFVKGDWRGDGGSMLFWHQYGMLRDGSGTLYFSEPVYHMFDFLGDRAEEVITMENDLLRVYGYRHSNHDNPRFGRDLEYLRQRGANHDH